MLRRPGKVSHLWQNPCASFAVGSGGVAAGDRPRLRSHRCQPLTSLGWVGLPNRLNPRLVGSALSVWPAWAEVCSVAYCRPYRGIHQHCHPQLHCWQDPSRNPHCGVRQVCPFHCQVPCPDHSQPANVHRSVVAAADQPGMVTNTQLQGGNYTKRR